MSDDAKRDRWHAALIDRQQRAEVDSCCCCRRPTRSDALCGGCDGQVCKRCQEREAGCKVCEGREEANADA